MNIFRKTGDRIQVLLKSERGQKLARPSKLIKIEFKIFLLLPLYLKPTHALI
jgi:hypothetical protein